MPSAAPIYPNALDSTPFKRDQTIIKSSWSNSIWNRKQVRIRVEDSGELSIQVVAQNTFARLTSTLLQFFSCGRIKSFGKKVVSLTQPGYLVPNLDVPLSEKTQKDILDIQTKKLALTLLSSCKRLNQLGEKLCRDALSQTEDPAIMEKVLQMNQEILDMQLPLTQQFQQDISPEDLYKNIQAFEAKAQTICEQYPLIFSYSLG